ncbi:Na/Pi cotransporter family protein [Acinetobacter sp. Marseille-Q1618]|uniref:Na/Pi cotransporter family protein n=1 Tax=Acinetobacter sp. Marseille-Q1618 TaxID=2697502 RepID=UPI001570AFEC|nr:Na/Pi symporter [Acinetobacter sp. Marseille-Q1618]
MLQVFAELCGGVGLFLLGMTLMTNGLKDITGETLKHLFTQFTNTPMKALLSGIGLTILVNSSTATTVATVGFVNAGVMTFAQAMGVVIGANIGTTSTGWLVAFLGLKFSISMFALPFIGFGAMLHLVAKDRLKLFGLILAGFGMIFFGIAVLQEAMAGFSNRVDLSFLSADGFWAKLLLVAIGIVMTLILQSSSASITATLAALASGAIDLSQALYLVIGQNIGSVGITILSAIGASINAKRTVAVNVIFNLVAAIVAFVLLAPVLLWLYQHISWLSRWDALVMVALFHTAFSMVGACIFMPVLKPLEALVIRLLPEHSPSILNCLDEASLQVPIVAIQAAETVQSHILFEIFNALHKAFRDGILPDKSKLKQLDDIILHLEAYLEKITIAHNPELQQHFLAILRVMVYVRVLRSDLEKIDNAALLRMHPAIFQLALDYSHILESYIENLSHLGEPTQIEKLRTELNALKKWASKHRTEIRNQVLEYTVLNQLNAAKSVELLAAQRWIERLIAHTYRFSNVLHESLVQEQK